MVCGCYLVPFPKKTPICDSCVVRWGSKNKHYKDIVPSNFIKYSPFDSEHNWEDPCTIFTSEINKYTLPLTISKSLEVQFVTDFSPQQKINASSTNQLIPTHTTQDSPWIAINISWRTWKNELHYNNHMPHAHYWNPVDILNVMLFICQLYDILSNDQGEPAVSYWWTGWVWEITSWSSKLQENHRSFKRSLWNMPQLNKGKTKGCQHVTDRTCKQ